MAKYYRDVDKKADHIGPLAYATKLKWIRKHYNYHLILLKEGIRTPLFFARVAITAALIWPDPGEGKISCPIRDCIASIDTYIKKRTSHKRHE